MGRNRRKTPARVLISVGDCVSHVPQQTSPPGETAKARQVRIQRNLRAVENEKSRLRTSMEASHSLIGVATAPPSPRPLFNEREIVVSGRIGVVQQALPPHVQSNDERHAREACNREAVGAEGRRLEALALEIKEGKKVAEQLPSHHPPRPTRPMIADGTFLADARRKYLQELSSERYQELLERGKNACSDDSDNGDERCGRDECDDSDDGLCVHDNDDEIYGWEDVTYKPMPASDVEAMLHREAQRLEEEGVWQWVPEDGSYHCIVPTFNRYEVLSRVDPDGEDGSRGDPLGKPAVKKGRGRPAVRTLPFEDVPQSTPQGTATAPIRVSLEITPDGEDAIKRKKRKERNARKLRNAGKEVRGRQKKHTQGKVTLTSPIHGARQATVQLDTTPLVETPRSRKSRRQSNQRTRINLTQRSLFDELQQANMSEHDKAKGKEKEDKRRSRMHGDPSLALARRQQHNEHNRRRRARQPTTDQQRLDQMYAAQESMLRCKQRNEYKQHRERHLDTAHRNREGRVPGFGNGKNRTPFPHSSSTA